MTSLYSQTLMKLNSGSSPIMRICCVRGCEESLQLRLWDDIQVVRSRQWETLLTWRRPPPPTPDTEIPCCPAAARKIYKKD